MINRLRVRIGGEEWNEELAIEILTTVTDRVKIRVGLLSIYSEIPELTKSIIVDVAAASYRRTIAKGDGISDESADTFKISYIEDLLKQYEPELSAIARDLAANDDGNGNATGVVRFL